MPSLRPWLAAAALASLACAPERIAARAGAPITPQITPAIGPAIPSSAPTAGLGLPPTVSRSAGPRTGSPDPIAASPDPIAATTPDEAVPLEPPGSPPVLPEVTITATDEAAWADRLRADFPTLPVAGPAALDLNREAITPVTGARGFNVPASHGPVGFVWNEGDREVEEWMPQGIGGFERDGRRWLVVAWYAKDLAEDTTRPEEALSYRGARVSLVDLTDPARVRYRHVLLVQDAANVARKELFRMRAPAVAGYRQGERFAPVPIHAGGVEVFDHWLYVVDTQLGVRVFDLDRLIAAEADPAKRACGVVDGRPVAFDYRYVLPQIAHYRVQGAAPYSCLALDRASMTLWVGQYLAPGTAEASAVTGLPLRADGRLGERATSMTFPKDKDGGAAFRVQGAFRRGDETWLAITGQSTYEGSTARLVAYRDGARTGHRWRWPHGAEDLYYDDARDLLWCLTEHPKRFWSRHDRVVFGVKLGTYRPAPLALGR